MLGMVLLWFCECFQENEGAIGDAVVRLRRDQTGISYANTI